MLAADLSAAATTPVWLGGVAVDKSIIAYIKEASTATGVSFDYLLAKAGQESSFSIRALSDTSSATGIYQFTEMTWLQLFALNGAKYGHARLASKIYRDRRGRYKVDNPTDRKVILNLRHDPRTSALLAAEYAKSNQTLMKAELKRNINSSDLYLAHFFGPGGAIKLLKAEAINEDTPASGLFPEAAMANPRVFYKKGQKSKTVKEVHEFLTKLFDGALKRYTNLSPAIIASLPQFLPSGEPTLNGPAKNPLVAPLTSKEFSFTSKDETDWLASDNDTTAINLDSYGDNGSDIFTLNLSDLDEQDTENNAAPTPKVYAIEQDKTEEKPVAVLPKTEELTKEAPLPEKIITQNDDAPDKSYVIPNKIATLEPSVKAQDKFSTPDNAVEVGFNLDEMSLDMDEDITTSAVGKIQLVKYAIENISDLVNFETASSYSPKHKQISFKDLSFTSNFEVAAAYINHKDYENKVKIMEYTFFEGENSSDFKEINYQKSQEIKYLSQFEIADAKSLEYSRASNDEQKAQRELFQSEEFYN